VHRDGDEVAVFSRSLDVLTGRMPEVVAAVRELPLGRAVLDGEAVLLDERGRPRPFQETAGRAATRGGAGSRLTPHFFDLLHLDGADLLDQPLERRIVALTGTVPPALLVDRTTVTDPDELAAALTRSVASGHEGVVVKSLAAPYEAGRRGGAWVKVKPRHTLDLVVLAAEWGHGRRRGWLSNLHLGARDPATGDFVMLGKTFKGLTDELLRWQTRRFLELATHRDTWLVRVRPEQVVEIAFDGVQTSTRYPGGVTLRFARVVRYRDDKPAAEADTIEAVRAIRRPLG
jgi:DNA ligase 1